MITENRPINPTAWVTVARPATAPLAAPSNHDALHDRARDILAPDKFAIEERLRLQARSGSITIFLLAYAHPMPYE